MDQTKEIRPGVGTETEINQAAALDSIVPSHPAPFTIAASVERQLETVLWALVSGEIELYHLTPALAAWWSLAHEYGCASRNSEVAQLTADRDRYYEVAFYGKNLAEVRRQRMDDASADFWEQFAQIGGAL
jgi:hypothetical protein